MNKDDHCSLSLQDRFNLYLSDPAIDRELYNVKRPTINVENLPTSIYYRGADEKSGTKSLLKKGSSATVATSAATRRTKKQDQKKLQKSALISSKVDTNLEPSCLADKVNGQNEDDLGNEKLSELLRCAACMSVPIYPKECRHCTKIVCDSCLVRYERSVTKQRNGVVCFLCKSEDPQAFRNIQSKILQDIIDKVKVAHRCTRFQELKVYTVAELKKHAESGNCSGYQYKCFCRSEYRYSYEGIRKHLREECEMVRLQCRYCHANQDYPSGSLDVAQMNHFNKNSMTREEFRTHSCYLEQKKIDESFQNPDTLSRIKCLLLQKSVDLQNKSKNGANQSQSQRSYLGGDKSPKIQALIDSQCKNEKCLFGWFDEPAPRFINQVQLEIFNPKKQKSKHNNIFECQRCKKSYDYLYQGPQNSCLSKKQDVLMRCSKCALPTCKFCLQQEVGLPIEQEEDNQTLSANEVTLQSILNLLNIKFDKNIKDSSDPYNNLQIQQQHRSSLEDDNVVDTDQIIEGMESIESAQVEEGAEQFLQSSNNFRSQHNVDDRALLNMD